MDNEFKDSIIKFLHAFEQVFDKDWVYTKQQLGIAEETEEQNLNSIDAIYFILPDGTFVNPNVEDEVNDWGYRAALLQKYRN